MSSSEIVGYVLAFIDGAAIGVVYFGALWWTVQRVWDSERPAVLFGLSFLLRTAFALTAFYLIMDGRWDRIALAVAAFILVRLIIVRRYFPLSDVENLQKDAQ